MVFQFNPFFFGAFLVVAVGTAIYTLCTAANPQVHGPQGHKQNKARRPPSPPPRLHPNNNKSNQPSSQLKKRRTSPFCTLCSKLISSEEMYELTDCNHSFHLMCIFDWFQNDLKRKSSCPTCSIEKCTICLLKMSQRIMEKKLSCGHSFHSSCIERWFKQMPTCPLCKA